MHDASPRPGSIPGDAFFTAPAPPPEPFVRSGRYSHALTLVGVGFVGTLVMSASLFTQIVIGAPVFEEMWKFGMALLLVQAFHVGTAATRVLSALVPGAAFGVLEHYLTYSFEDPLPFVFRVAFHAGMTALSMATWHALVDAEEPRLVWLATGPATVVHWFNNFSALVLVLPSIFLQEAELVALVFGATALVAGYAGVLVAILRPAAVRRIAARAWHAIPEDLRR